MIISMLYVFKDFLALKFLVSSLNMQQENNDQQKQQPIWCKLVSLQSHLDSADQENQKIEVRLGLVKSRYNFLLQERLKKFEKIAAAYSKVQSWMLANEQSVKRILQRMKVSLQMGDVSRANQVRFSVPVYNLEYIMNSPRVGKAVSERIKQEEDRITKQKNGREDEIRSLKIRISLGEIELKQLRNRVKKM